MSHRSSQSAPTHSITAASLCWSIITSDIMLFVWRAAIAVLPISMLWTFISASSGIFRERVGSQRYVHVNSKIQVFNTSHCYDIMCQSDKLLQTWVFVLTSVVFHPVTHSVGGLIWCPQIISRASQPNTVSSSILLNNRIRRGPVFKPPPKKKTQNKTEFGFLQLIRCHFMFFFSFLDTLKQIPICFRCLGFSMVAIWLWLHFHFGANLSFNAQTVHFSMQHDLQSIFMCGFSYEEKENV